MRRLTIVIATVAAIGCDSQSAQQTPPNVTSPVLPQMPTAQTVPTVPSPSTSIGKDAERHLKGKVYPTDFIQQRVAEFTHLFNLGLQPTPLDSESVKAKVANDTAAESIIRELNGSNGADSLAQVLVSKLADSDPRAQARAIHCFRILEPGYSQAVSPLIKIVDNSNRDVQTSAVASLAVVCASGGRRPQPAETPQAVKAIMKYMQQIQSPESLLGKQEGEIAMMAFQSIGRQADEAVPYIAPFLKDRDYKLRVHACEVISRIGGPRAKQLIPAIRDVANEMDPKVGPRAAIALKRLEAQVE